MKTLVSATILLISLTNATAQSAGTASVSPVYVQQQPAVPPSRSASPTPAQSARTPEVNSVVIAGNQLLQTGDFEDHAREMVLVVPGPDLKPEAIAAVTEDLTVMCRIFDKALYPGKRSAGASLYSSRGDLPMLGRLLMQQTGWTQGLYLHGYGAVFFVQVGFPLVAPPQQKQETKPEESTDHVWSQTMSEVRGEEDPRDADTGGPAYDAQKVESLKTALIRTLRHAANLRVRPEDQITVVVGSHGTMAGPAHEDLGWFYSQERRGFIPAENRKRPESLLPDPAATLVLRAAKSDLDALAAGKLTAEQFAPKVQTLWTRPQAQPQEPQSTQAPGAASR